MRCRLLKEQYDGQVRISEDLEREVLLLRKESYKLQMENQYLLAENYKLKAAKGFRDRTLVVWRDKGDTGRVSASADKRSLASGDT